MSDRATMTDGDRIWAILVERRGRERAILSTEIAAELEWPSSRERLVREIIAAEWRQWPELVCSTPGNGGGFFVPANCSEIHDQELALFAARFNAVAKHEAFQNRARELGFNIVDRDKATIIGEPDPFADGIREGMAGIMASKERGLPK